MDSLCMSCGLCCDGTMYTTVSVTDDDQPANLEQAGFHIQIHADSRRTGPTQP